MSSLARRIIAEKSYVVQLITGHTADKQPFYVFLLMPAILQEKLEAAIQEGETNLEKFGVVLASGEGHEPPDALKAQIKERFG
ncbi:MAG: hypothetical protein H6908_06550 [Hyphomicrobiales bacterium]|nr:hypothetical protein [Hyphomicrobiales bacterium]